MNKEYYQQKIQEVATQIDSNATGLTYEEVEQRQRDYGRNELIGKKQKGIYQLFLETFKDTMVIILVSVSVIQLLLGAHIEAIVIISVLLVNAVVSVLQEKKAMSSLEALKNLSAPEAKVIRNNEETLVAARDLVVGDIVILEAGDYVPADGRLIETVSLKIEEGMLTGESVSVEKNSQIIEKEVPLGDRVNMVYSGTVVTNGRGRFLVTAIGNQTEIGKVANLLDEAADQKTPLQKGLDHFSHKLSLFILGIALLILVVQLTRLVSNGLSGEILPQVMSAVMFAVAVAVAAIPEALQSIVTIVLSMGTKKMAKKNAIVRQLPAVETLGAASVICTDKTGTLTQNKMTVVETYLLNDSKHLTDTSKLMTISSLVNDVTISGEGILNGDPTEAALVAYAKEKGLAVQKIKKEFPRQTELPFDSTRKLMSTVHEVKGNNELFIKGAPDVLLTRSTHVLYQGKVEKMTEEKRQQIERQNHYFATRALRVLAFGYKEIPQENVTVEDENNLVFVGLIAMIDPPRKEVYAAVKQARLAGIKTVMITGDHKVTAVAIAKDIGIFQKDDMALTGSELDEMSDESLASKLEKISVYARVSPENKIRIVKAWQAKGHVSAMTGDGVNDAPALKQADIGIAMGSGTDVAKDAAAMVLTDDNFASIIGAVSVGRNVYDNIKKAIGYLFGGNLGAIIAILFALIIGWESPFTALQLLFINLVNDSLPAIALGMEKEEKNIMQRKPRDTNEGILTKEMLLAIGYRGSLIGIAVIVSQLIGRQISPEMGGAMAFSTLILSRTLQLFTARSQSESMFRLNLRLNKMMLIALVMCGLFYALTLLPSIRAIFSVPQIFEGLQVVISLGLALIAVIMMEGMKFISNKLKIHQIVRAQSLQK